LSRLSRGRSLRGAGFGAGAEGGDAGEPEVSEEPQEVWRGGRRRQRSN